MKEKAKKDSIVISAEDFEQMQTIEDCWWAKKADEASLEGFLGQDESEQFLVEMMN